MGQAFTAIIIDDDGTAHSYNPRCETTNAFSGNKLTEHALVGDPYTDFVSQKLYHNPVRLAWLGSNATEESGSACDVYRAHASELTTNVIRTGYSKAAPFKYEGKYLVNHDTNEYLNLSLYLNDTRLEWVLYPVAILTAIGNGLGGGDYHGTEEYLVGSWALNRLSIEDEPPEGGENLATEFMYEEDILFIET